MRLLLAFLLGIFLIDGCGRSDDGPTPQQQAPTPQQQAQLDARQSTISQLETMFHRPLTEQEKLCVTTRPIDHGIEIGISWPLDGAVKEWQQRKVATQP